MFRFTVQDKQLFVTLSDVADFIHLEIRSWRHQSQYNVIQLLGKLKLIFGQVMGLIQIIFKDTTVTCTAGTKVLSVYLDVTARHSRVN